MMGLGRCFDGWGGCCDGSWVVVLMGYGGL